MSKKNHAMNPAPAALEAAAADPVAASDELEAAAADPVAASDELEAAADPVEPTREALAKVLLRSAHGLMVHPYKPLQINTDSITEVDEVDSWLQSQIAEGKLLVI